MKEEQRILDPNATGGGCYWRLEVIPDTFDEFYKKYSDLIQYKKAKETKTKMSEDYKLLNPNFYVDKQSNKRTGKSKESECIDKEDTE